MPAEPQQQARNKASECEGGGDGGGGGGAAAALPSRWQGALNGEAGAWRLFRPPKIAASALRAYVAGARRAHGQGEKRVQVGNKDVGVRSERCRGRAPWRSDFGVKSRPSALETHWMATLPEHSVRLNSSSTMVSTACWGRAYLQRCAGGPGVGWGGLGDGWWGGGGGGGGGPRGGMSSSGGRLRCAARRCVTRAGRCPQAGRGLVQRPLARLKP